MGFTPSHAHDSTSSTDPITRETLEPLPTKQCGPMLTEVVNAESGDFLEAGFKSGSFLIGESIEVGGVRRTIVRIDYPVFKPNPSGFPDTYQILYVS